MTAEKPIPFPVKEHATQADAEAAAARDIADGKPAIVLPDQLAVGGTPLVEQVAVPCCKCGKPAGMVNADIAEAQRNKQLCATCFSLAVNAQGTRADQRAEQPIRLTWHQTLDADDVKRKGAALPVAIFDMISNGAETVSAKLASGPAGLAALAAQAGEHGLLVMVIVQPAKRMEQAPPAAPNADVSKARGALADLKRRTGKKRV